MSYQMLKKKIKTYTMNNIDETVKGAFQLIGILVLVGLVKYGFENYVKPGEWDMAAYKSIESYEPDFFKEYRTEELCKAAGEKFLSNKLYVSFQCNKGCKYFIDGEGQYSKCN